LDLTAVGRREAFQDFDRGGLAGAVRAEQAEAFACGDGEVEPRDGDDIAVALGETDTADGGRGGQEDCVSLLGPGIALLSSIAGIAAYKLAESEPSGNGRGR
jgi:hypothetical protein